MTDPIVFEVREARAAHARRFDFDLSAICADLKKVEKRCGHKLVSMKPKKMKRASPKRAVAA